MSGLRWPRESQASWTLLLPQEQDRVRAGLQGPATTKPCGLSFRILYPPLVTGWGLLTGMSIKAAPAEFLILIGTDCFSCLQLPWTHGGSKQHF